MATPNGPSGDEPAAQPPTAADAASASAYDTTEGAGAALNHGGAVENPTYAPQHRHRKTPPYAPAENPTYAPQHCHRKNPAYAPAGTGDGVNLVVRAYPIPNEREVMLY